MAYLRIYSARNGIIGTSINAISKKIGYEPNTNAGRINKKIIESLKWLVQKEYVTINIDIDNALSNNYFDITLNNIFDCNTNYVILTECEFDIITNADTKKKNKENLLRVFLNIKKYMSFSKDNIQLCYPSHSTLCRDCNISSKGAMNNIIADLVSMGLLYTYNPGRFIDKGKVKYANNFYALENGILLPDMCDEIMLNYYFTQGITIKQFIKEDI